MRKVFICLLLTYAFVGCSEQDSSSIEETAELSYQIVDSAINYQTLHSLSIDGRATSDFILYDVQQIEGVYVFANPIVVERNKHQEAYFATMKHLSGISIQLNHQNRYVVVCCTDSSGELTCVTCDGNPVEQSQCMLNAIDACLNSGGCSTICNAEKMVYDSKKDEFFFYRLPKMK